MSLLVQLYNFQVAVTIRSRACIRGCRQIIELAGCSTRNDPFLAKITRMAKHILRAPASTNDATLTKHA